jgi:hypothetical protein
MSAAGGSTSAVYVWVKYKERLFAKVRFAPGNDVADVTALACRELDVGQHQSNVWLFQVAEADAPKPSQSAIAEALSGRQEPLDENAKPVPGAWLVAALVAPPGGAGGSDGEWGICFRWSQDLKSPP